MSKEIPFSDLKICSNCANWALEPGSLDSRHQGILLKLFTGQSGIPVEEIPNEAVMRIKAGGHCIAVSPHKFTTGGQDCDVYDENGNFCFTPVPVG